MVQIEFRHEMRAMADGIDRAFERHAWRRAFHDDDGGASVSRNVLIGPADHA
jgi:hypothetical protein